MDEPIHLNQEKQYKIESYSNAKNETISTLQQPVSQTIKRDLNNIFTKIKTTLSGQGDYAKLRKQWDLWGPLMISMMTSTLVTFGTNADREQVFTTLFLVLWIGPLAITLNSRLLGAKIPLIQSVCLIIYCTSPIMMLSFVIFVLGFIFHSFIFNLILALGALLFTLRCNHSYFESLVPKQKSILNMYPILLFYTFICIFVAMS